MLYQQRVKPCYLSYSLLWFCCPCTPSPALTVFCISLGFSPLHGPTAPNSQGLIPGGQVPDQAAYMRSQTREERPNPSQLLQPNWQSERLFMTEHPYFLVWWGGWFIVWFWFFLAFDCFFFPFMFSFVKNSKAEKRPLFCQQLTQYSKQGLVFSC